MFRWEIEQDVFEPKHRLKYWRARVREAEPTGLRLSGIVRLRTCDGAVVMDREIIADVNSREIRVDWLDVAHFRMDRSRLHLYAGRAWIDRFLGVLGR